MSAGEWRAGRRDNFPWSVVFAKWVHAVESSRQANYELLIADDDPGFRETLKHIFEPHFHTVEASCGEEVLEIVQRREVHLILLDMHMQHLTGLETCRIVVQEMNLILPCILITADATEELRRAWANEPVRRASRGALFLGGRPILRLGR